MTTNIRPRKTRTNTAEVARTSFSQRRFHRVAEYTLAYAMLMVVATFLIGVIALT